MEIVLLEDVKALGKKGQIVKVNDGYARNFILPKKLGVEATAKNLNDLKLQKANAAKVAAEQLAAAKELAEKIESGQVVLKMKAGEGGKAFGSVSGKEIAAAASEQLGLDTDSGNSLSIIVWISKAQGLIWLTVCMKKPGFMISVKPGLIF